MRIVPMCHRVYVSLCLCVYCTIKLESGSEYDLNKRINSSTKENVAVSLFRVQKKMLPCLLLYQVLNIFHISKAPVTCHIDSLFYMWQRYASLLQIASTQSSDFPPSVSHFRKFIRSTRNCCQHSAMETGSETLSNWDRRWDTRQWRQEVRYSAMETGS